MAVCAMQIMKGPFRFLTAPQHAGARAQTFGGMQSAKEMKLDLDDAIQTSRAPLLIWRRLSCDLSRIMMMISVCLSSQARLHCAQVLEHNERTNGARVERLPELAYPDDRVLVSRERICDAREARDPDHFCRSSDHNLE